MEDRDTAQGTTAPFGVVAIESGIHGVEEWADEGNLHGRTHDRTLSDDVGNCTRAAVSNAAPETQ